MLSADFAGNRSEFCEFGGADPRARVDRPSSYPLHCPICGTGREAAFAWLYNAKGSSALKCEPCARYMASHKLLCPCNRPWIQCETHRALGFACRGTRNLHTMSSKSSSQSSQDMHIHVSHGRKRPLAHGEHSQALKRCRRAVDATSQVRSSIAVHVSPDPVGVEPGRSQRPTINATCLGSRGLGARARLRPARTTSASIISLIIKVLALRSRLIALIRPSSSPFMLIFLAHITTQEATCLLLFVVRLRKTNLLPLPTARGRCQRSISIETTRRFWVGTLGLLVTLGRAHLISVVLVFLSR